MRCPNRPESPRISLNVREQPPRPYMASSAQPSGEPAPQPAPRFMSVTPEVAGSSPVAPVKALQIGHGNGHRGSSEGSRTQRGQLAIQAHNEQIAPAAAELLLRGGDHALVAPPRQRSAGQASQRPTNCGGLRLRLVPGLLHDRRHLGVGDEALPALLVPVEDRPRPDPPRRGRGRRARPSTPCCLRFSAPFVEKTSRKRSRSSTCVVARSMSFSFLVRVVGVMCAAAGSVERGPACRRGAPAGRSPRGSRRSRTGRSRAWAMYMFRRRWCWPGTIAAGPPGPSAISRVVEGGDHVLLVERAGLGHRRGPEPQPAVQARAGAAAGELRVAGIERVVLLEQLRG